MSVVAAANASKKGKKVTCKTNDGPATTLYVSSNGNASAAPVASVPAVSNANAKAAKKAEVDTIIAAIDAAVNATVTKANLDQFNALLTRYTAAVPGATEVKVIPAATGEGDLLGLVKAAVVAVKASAASMKGGRRKTHRKKHSMRSKRHCKTHKKHGGKRSTKHHKKHGKTRGKRSKTHKKRHHKKH
jgi:hypothetical protein